MNYGTGMGLWRNSVFWKTGVLSPVWVQGSYFESDIYDDERNRETVRAFDREFTYG